MSYKKSESYKDISSIDGQDIRSIDPPPQKKRISQQYHVNRPIDIAYCSFVILYVSTNKWIM